MEQIEVHTTIVLVINNKLSNNVNILNRCIKDMNILSRDLFQIKFFEENKEMEGTKGVVLIIYKINQI